ncbi:MAG: ATP-dependent Clp protease ATP-binding subunit [Armatimonadetes bacterium]|nr:ATP-dependent Clp protease ATP-binding subunit [Armatimonadota bacterium]
MVDNPSPTEELPFDEAVELLVEHTKNVASRFGQEPSFGHLLLAVLERHLTMVERICPGVDWQKLRMDLPAKIAACLPELAFPLDTVTQRATAIAVEEGTNQVRVRQFVQAVTEVAVERLELPQSGPEVAADGQLGEQSPATDKPFRSYSKPLSSTPVLDELGVDLTEKARRGELPPVIGRDREIDTLVSVLCRRYKRNPLLVGPAGVGKTAIVEGLAQRIAAGDVPAELKNARIVQIPATILLQGASSPPDIEERMKALIREASQPGVILFIDEIHRVIGAGGLPGLHDLAQRLKPALARGAIACIGATTESEFRAYIQNDRALERRFQPLRVDELSRETTREILRRLASDWKEETNISIPEAVLERIVELSEQYLRNRRFPDKAIELLDTILSEARLQDVTEVSDQLVVQTAARLAGMPPKGN